MLVLLLVAVSTMADADANAMHGVDSLDRAVGMLHKPICNYGSHSDEGGGRSCVHKTSTGTGMALTRTTTPIHTG
eukprot:6756477-Alexandrium_andersonii.AAC.1